MINHTMKGRRAEANHIRNSWVMSCDPRVKSPALRGMVPRAEWCCSLPGRARSDQVSGPAMEGLHAPLGFGQKFGVHLGVFALDDEVEREEGILGRELPPAILLG